MAPHQQEIKVRLANGESIQVIAEEYGVKPSSLKNWLRRNGWCKANSILLMQGPNKFRPKRKKRELKLDRHRAEIEKMIEARWSTKEICKALGCEVNTWHRWIKARGVTKLRLVKEHRLDPHREDVEASLANDEPYPAIAARHEVSVPTLRGWLKSRKIEKPQRRIKTVCAAIVAPHLQEIEARIAKGELIRVLAEEHGVKPSSLAGWLRRKKTSKQNQES